MTLAGPAVAAAGLTLAVRWGGSQLSAGDAFASIWLLELVRGALAPLRACGAAACRMGAASVRLAAVLARKPQTAGLGTSAWPPALRSTLASRTGGLIAVIGPPASGKTRLARALAAAASRLPLRGRFAWAPPEPFLISGLTLRANVFFGAPFDPRRYDAVLRATLLQRYIFAHLPAGDATLADDAAVRALPRGGRQLVALARALYSTAPAVGIACSLSELPPPAAEALLRALRGGERDLCAGWRIMVLDGASAHLLLSASSSGDQGLAVLLRGPLDPAGAGIAAVGRPAALLSHPALATLLRGGNGEGRSRATIRAGVEAAAEALDSPQRRQRQLRRCASASGADRGTPRLTASLPAPAAAVEHHSVSRNPVHVVAALAVLAQLALGAATWALAVTLDAGRIGHRASEAEAESVSTPLPMPLSLAIMGLLSLSGAALLAMAAAGACAAAASLLPAVLGEAGRIKRAYTAATMLCASAFLASAALLAALSPQSLAASAPAAALLVALARSHHRKSPSHVAASASIDAQLAQAALLRDLTPLHAAEVVAAHGASRLMSARLAGQLDDQCAAEQTLTRIFTFYGVCFDVAGAALLAAALWSANGGPGRTGWAVLQARVAGAALRIGWALVMAAPPEAT